jgi:ABC-type lipoprotein export system ATPase subunit
MIVKRLQVEEGFLNGLDLSLDHGLTVLIGARGSGKTSIVELIRFCLDVPSYTATAGERAYKQAVEVLGSGKVTITLDVDGEVLKVSRSAAETKPRTSSDRAFAPPIVLSQSEIEQVGLHEDSRQRLLDGFVPSLRESNAAENAARALIASLTVELREVLTERGATLEDLKRLASVGQELVEARAAALEANAGLEKTVAERTRLAQLDQLTAQGGVRVTALARAVSAVQRRLDLVRPSLDARPLEPWPAAGGSDDLLAAVRAELVKADNLTRAAEDRVRAALQLAHALEQAEQAAQLALEDEARTLRTYLDQLSAGAGLLLKRVGDLEGAQQRAAALKEHAANLGERATAIGARRNEELDRLDVLRESRVNAREQAASFLNSRLGPKIRVTVNRFGSVDDYADAIAAALRGSGLQYNLLAPELARVISPRELARAAEEESPEAIAAITGIAIDRAQRVASHLRHVGTESVLTAPVGDTVEIGLLDGGIYKPANDLSVGQRCTVVLPIILTHTERVLIVDQPEDNLDNSFIAETLVKALRNRSSTSQLVFATHNPNVPVLAEADLVIYMRSDGKRGYVAHAGELDDVASVRAISDVMEGGRRAFETRATFYATEYSDDDEG